MFKVVLVDDQERISIYGDKVCLDKICPVEAINVLFTLVKSGKAVVIMPSEEEKKAEEKPEETEQNADTVK